MSRSGYSEDGDDQWELIRWRGAVHSATVGKRGQEFFKALVAALDALPEKKLITELLEASDGNVCALGALGKARSLDMRDLDPEDYTAVAETFGIGEPIKGKTYRADGWVYRDLPNLSLENFDKLVGVIGAANLVWPTLAERTWPDGAETKRGQCFVSPEGIENLRKYKDFSHDQSE